MNNIVFCTTSECPKKDYCERYSGVRPSDKESFETDFRKHLSIEEDRCFKFIPLGKRVGVETTTFMHKLSLIPEPARSKAIGHASKKFDLFENHTRFTSTAVSCFKWSDTPEGEQYWEKVMLWCQYNIDKMKVRDPGEFPETPVDNTHWMYRM